MTVAVYSFPQTSRDGELGPTMHVIVPVLDPPGVVVNPETINMLPVELVNPVPHERDPVTSF